MSSPIVRDTAPTAQDLAQIPYGARRLTLDRLYGAAQLTLRREVRHPDPAVRLAARLRAAARLERWRAWLTPEDTQGRATP